MLCPRVCAHAGNRTSLRDGSGITTSTYDNANRTRYSQTLSGRTTYVFDNAGNQVKERLPSGQITTSTWDADQRQVQVALPAGEVVTFVWAPVTRVGDQRVISRDDGTNTTRLIWDNQNFIQEVDDLNAVDADYTYQPQPYGHLVSDRRSGTSSFYRYDAIQSTTALTNSAGTTTDEFRYKAYGPVLYHTGTSDTPYQYVGDLGYRQDPDTGSLNLRERMYDPKTGRFESEDPLREDAGDSNFYRYVANDPINSSDPSGLDADLRFQSNPAIKGAPIFIRNSEGGRLDGYVGNYVTNGQSGQSMVWRMVNGKAYCLPFSQLVITARGGYIYETRDWDDKFELEGKLCSPDTGKLLPRPSISQPAPSPAICVPSKPSRVEIVPGLNRYKFPEPSNSATDGNCAPLGRKDCEASYWLKSDRDDMLASIEQFSKEAVSLGIDVTPIIGSLKQIVDTVSGKDSLTDREFSSFENSLNAAMAPLFFVPPAVRKWLARKLLPILQRLRGLIGGKCSSPAAKKALAKLDDFIKTLEGGSSNPLIDSGIHKLDDAPSNRSQRLTDLSKDLDHGGKITPKTTREAEYILEAEDAGILKGAKRPCGPEKGDFVDANGRAIDVKFTDPESPRGLSYVNKKTGVSGMQTFFEKTKKAIASGEFQLLDSRNLTADQLKEIRAWISSNGFTADQIRIWP
ncbi:RHS repeat-associated core domain-containing protein [Schlesneria sp. DSM 10557]|uniref:RHS repeat-associated core domain-containing protein n=1 Tax=Schlesneria sp. DSM 10557 TaxID=3044399 RepID=UPI0035A168C8